MRDRLFLALLSLVLTAAIRGERPEVGQLCVDGAPSCREARCGDALAGQPDNRTFTFRTGGGTYVLAVVPAGGTVIPCSADGALQLHVTGGKMQPDAIVEVSIRGPEGLTWKTRFEPRQLAKPLLLRLPAGPVEVVVSAPGHQTWRRSITVARDRALLTAELKELPRITGVVRARGTRQPVVEAVVSTPAGGLSAVTDGAGRFALEVASGEWPEFLVVRAVPFAELEVRVPPARVTSDLEDVYLDLGGSVRVEVQADGPREPLDVELRRIVRNRASGSPLRSLRAAEAVSAPVVFTNVEPGEYAVLVKGDGPFERHGGAVTVRAGEVSTVQMKLTPFEVRLKAVLDGTALAGSEILYTNLSGFWDATAKTDAEGEVALSLWQGGRTKSTVLSTALSAPYIARRTLADDRDSEWLLDVPAHGVTGVVVDAKTGKPVGGAKVSLHVHGDDGSSLGVNAQADEQGVFELHPVPPGKHTLKVGAARYQPAELTYVFGANEGRRNVTIQLSPADLVELTVLDHQGVGIPAARVIQIRGGLRMEGRTDAAGKLSVPLAANETAELFIVPRDGSFAVAQVRGDERERTIRVPEGSCRLVLRAESGAGEPIPSVAVLLRHRGSLIPYDLLEAIASAQGARLRSDAAGRLVFDRMPAGLYEVWPAGSPAETRALAAGVGPEAPLKIVAVPGENVAIMTFKAAAP